MRYNLSSKAFQYCTRYPPVCKGKSDKSAVPIMPSGAATAHPRTCAPGNLAGRYKLRRASTHCFTCYFMSISDVVPCANSVTVRLLKYPAMDMKYQYPLKSFQIPVPQNLESSAPGIFDVWQENQMQLFAKKNSWRNSRKVTVSVTLFQICFVCV